MNKDGKKIRQHIENEFDIALEDSGDRTELADPAPLIAAYSATVATLGFSSRYTTHYKMRANQSALSSHIRAKERSTLML